MRATLTWPADNPEVADLSLLLSRGRLEAVIARGFADGAREGLLLRHEIGLTRLRLSRPTDTEISRIELEVNQTGEPRIGDPRRWLDPRQMSLDELSQEDIDEYLNCRRSRASGTDPVARGRKFFLALDERTKNELCRANCKELSDALHQVGQRMRERVDYNKSTPTSGVDPNAMSLITAIFDVSSPYGADEFDAELDAYLWFAAGLLEHECPFTDVAAGPNSANVFFFAELAFAAVERPKSVEAAYWIRRLPTLVLMQELFRLRFTGLPRHWRALGEHRRGKLDRGEVEQAKKDLLPTYTADPEKASNEIIDKTITTMGPILA